jgi:chemotaxis family two-component system sensor kinase Cph1
MGTRDPVTQTTPKSDTFEKLPSSAEIDFSKCEKEPIATPGAVQSFGAVLIISKGLVISCSKNIETFLSYRSDVLLDKSLEATAPDFWMAIEKTLSLLKKQESCFQIYKNRFVGLRLEENGNFIAEFFPSKFHSVDLAALEDQVVQLSRKYHFPVLDRNRFLAEVCELFQRHLRFNQAFVQLIDSKDFIEVIAEANDGKIEAVNGLHFSSKEIPNQARGLYLKQRIRFKQDASSSPIELMGASKDLIDLTYSPLREPSNFLTLYMQNMNLATMLSLSIVVEGKLYALLTMHNKEPLVLDPSLFDYLTFIINKVSTEILRIDELLNKNTESKLSEILEVELPMNQSQSLEQIISLSNFDTLLSHCGSVLIKDSKILFQKGEIPSPETLISIQNLILKSKSDIHSSSQITQDYCLSKVDTEVFGGVLGLKFDGICALFFRKTFPLELLRRGANLQADNASIVPRLSPEGSFRFWKEEFNNRSRAWSQKDLALGGALLKRISQQSPPPSGPIPST